MNKPQIRIYDTQFKHSLGGSFGTGDLNIKPSYFEFSWTDCPGDVAVITESGFHGIDQVREKIKIALILEAESIDPDGYSFIRKQENYCKFDLVLTHGRNMLTIDPRFQPYIFGGMWIRPNEWGINPKTKEVSIIVSNKKMTPNQNLRHEVVEKLSKKYGIDVFGRGYNPIDSKMEALKDYKYSIVIENETALLFFTEKIIDCFATGTVPIYVGSPIINQWFEGRGIMHCENISDIESALIHIRSVINYDNFYEDRALNHDLASKYIMPEDAIWENHLKKYYE